jgi:hypothetical protein
VSTTYCVVLLFCLSSYCVPYVASFSVFLLCLSSYCVPYVANFSVLLFCLSSYCVPYVASFSVFLFCLSSYCVPYVASFSVFLLCLSSYCVPYVASSSGLHFSLSLRYSLTFIDLQCYWTKTCYFCLSDDEQLVFRNIRCVCNNHAAVSDCVWCLF